MNKKEKELEQHLYHEVDDNNIVDFLQDTAPIIGEIVQTFNGLEQYLNSFICEMITERSDEMGLAIIYQMPYSAKVDLFDRLSSFFHEYAEIDIGAYSKLLKHLREAGKKRNIVVHADYESVEKDGFAYSKVKLTKGRFIQEYVQLTAKSLHDVLEYIELTDSLLDFYYEVREDYLSR